VATYACDRSATLDSLATYWLPMLKRLQLSVPVIVAGCKLDLRSSGGNGGDGGGDAGRTPGALEADMAPIMGQFPEVETCLECSALSRVQVKEVFYYAQRAVVHPTSPLSTPRTIACAPLRARAQAHLPAMRPRPRLAAQRPRAQLLPGALGHPTPQQVLCHIKRNSAPSIVLELERRSPPPPRPGTLGHQGGSSLGIRGK